MKAIPSVVLSLLLCGQAVADGDADYIEARGLVESGAILPLERILEQVRVDHPGRILDVEFEREDGWYIYEIEILDGGGVVWEQKLDAATGRFLEKELED